MSHLFGFIKALLPHLPTQQELDEAYLCQSVDIFDMERRMAEIDHRAQGAPWQTPTYILGVRT